MFKVKLKEIKEHSGEDITTASVAECQDLKAFHTFEKVAYSCGQLGINGLLLRDEYGNYFKITSRTASLFFFAGS